MDQLLEYILGHSGLMAYVIVFVFLLLGGMGLPISEDLTLIAGGVIAYYGEANVYIMIAVAFFGVLLADSIMFTLGARYGRTLTRKWFFAKILPPVRLTMMEKKLNEKGLKLLFIARFMPGIRAAVFFTAGTLRVPYRYFLLCDATAAFFSIPLIIYVVYAFGGELDEIVGMVKRLEFGILGVIIAAVVYFLGKRLWRRKRLRRAELDSQIK
jgi:membrane protein DedA with SNARE-associated domain